MATSLKHVQLVPVLHR